MTTLVAPDLGSRRLLVAGVAVGLLLFVLTLAAVVSGWPPLARIDDSVMDYFGGLGPAVAWWVPWWHAISNLFSPTSFRIAAVIALAVLLRRDSHDQLAVTLLLIGVLGGGLVPNGVKELVHRPRPSMALVEAYGSSFPSAHSFGIVVGVLTALVLVRRRVRPTTFRLLGLVGVGLIATVCFARVALDVHYFSDVLAGASLGLAWFCTVALLAPHLPGRRKQEPPASSSR